MQYTYVLQSMKDGKLYTGCTENLKQRVEQHNKGFIDSTKNRLPLFLVYYEACLSDADAISRQKFFKTYDGRSYLIKRLKSNLTGTLC